MADRYWIGLANGPAGPAYTNTTANWSATSGGPGGASVPSSIDNVFLDANSNPIPLSFNGNFFCNNFDTTGFGGSLDFAGASGITLNGNVVINCPITNPALQSQLTLSADTGFTNSVNLTGIGPNALAFNIYVMGTMNLTGSFLCRNFNVTSNGGTINTNGNNITCSSTFNLPNGVTFNPSTSTIRAQIVNIIGTLGPTVDSTFIAETSFSGGSRTFGTVNFEVPEGQTLLVAGNNIFTTLNFNGGNGSRVNFTAATTGAGQTITNLNINGPAEYCFLGSTAINGGRCTVNNVTMSNVIFDRFTPFAGGAIWTGTNIGVLANAPAITATPATTVTATINGAKDWFDTTIWDLGRAPLPDDTAVINFTNASGDGINNVGGRVFYAGSLQLTSSVPSAVVDGNLGAARLTLMNGGYSVGNEITFITAARSPSIIFSAKNAGTYIISSSIDPNAGNGTSSSTMTIAAASNAGAVYVIDSNFRINGALQFLGSSLTLGTGISLFCSSFVCTGAVARTLNLGSNTTFTVRGTLTVWNIAGSLYTVNKGTSTIVVEAASASACTFTGGAVEYYNLVIAGNFSAQLAIGGINTWNKISSTRTGVAWTLNMLATQTVSEFEVSGSPGTPVTIAGNMTKVGGGIVSVNYLTLSGTTVTPSLTWYAGGNSTAAGSSTGWILAFPPGTGATVSSLFFCGGI